MVDQEDKCNCCVVKSMCGRSLWQGVVFVAISSLLLSTIVFAVSAASVAHMSRSNVQFNSHPLMAVNLIFGLVSACISIYQIIISSLLLWQALQTRGNIFLCSVWYVSHLSILTLYCIICSARSLVCFEDKRYFPGIATIILGIVYEGTCILISNGICLAAYVERVVNRYRNLN